MFLLINSIIIYIHRKSRGKLLFQERQKCSLRRKNAHISSFSDRLVIITVCTCTMYMPLSRQNRSEKTETDRRWLWPSGSIAPHTYAPHANWHTIPRWKRILITKLSDWLIRVAESTESAATPPPFSMIKHTHIQSQMLWLRPHLIWGANR